MTRLAEILNNSLGDFTIFASFVAKYLLETGNS